MNQLESYFYRGSQAVTTKPKNIKNNVHHDNGRNFAPSTDKPSHRDIELLEDQNNIE